MDLNFFKSSAMKRMVIAREAVARKNPFFASILFCARMIQSDKVKTIVTNGNDVYFNKDFVEDKKNDKFIEGILLECVLHCALTHKARQKYRGDKIWNEATGYSVGPIVKDYFPVNPEYTLVNPGFQGKTAEGIYEWLEQNQQKQPKKPQKGKGQSGGSGPKGQGQGDPEDEGDGDEERPGGMIPPDRDPENDGDGQGQSDRDAEDQEREWRRPLSNAVEKSKKAGTLPGSIERLVNELMPREKLNWRDVIRDMSRDAKAKTSRTWSKPNRRRLGSGDYMPGYGNDNVYRLVVCFDVSGSVDHNMHKEMREEVCALLDQNIINRLTLIAVDTEVHSEVDVTTSEEVQAWEPRGGGGTDFRSAMHHISKMEDVIGVAFLTDMQTSSFGDPPGPPVVWVDWEHGNSPAPYGRTMFYR